ncbi:MAG: hypothetical protein AAB227_04740 [Pseudomonadota bacterium]
MIRRLILLGALVLAGCASPAAKNAKLGVVGAPSGAGDVVIGALPDPSLPAGECGMILWTLEENQPAAIVRLTSGKGAEMSVNGAVVKFAITQTSGAAGFGIFEDQSLAADGLTATIKVRFGLGFDGGSYLERGLVTIESASGWRTVIPAAGVAGCRTK